MYKFCSIIAIFFALLLVCSAGRLSADLPRTPDDPPWQDPMAVEDDENKPLEETKPRTSKKGCASFSMVDCMVVLAVLGACVHLKRNLRKGRKQE